MKAITLHEPWASLMRIGVKQNETRSWPTQHRGELAICSAKRVPKIEELSVEVLDILWLYRDKLKGHSEARLNGVESVLRLLPLGSVVCVVDIKSCIPTGQALRACLIGSTEMACGNYGPDRFVWQSKNLRPMQCAVPVLGRQGFFNLPADVEAKVKKQL